MRLLERKDSGEAILTKDYINDIPHYAILSHTWGDDKDEVSFKEFMEGSGKTKAGYRKIQFCGAQAARDGLRYFWVDTCCIDKGNNVELSEAIIPCSAGTIMQSSVMYIWLMSQSMVGILPNDLFIHGSQLFGIVDGLPEAGHFKSLFLRRQLSSSP
jgi:hypothetical protein